MTNTTVLISGAGVAGAALGHYLHRDGYDVTVVERAPGLRGSGYAVDFRGAAFDVLDELGILDEIRGHDTAMRGTTVVDADGAEIGQLPAETFAGELEVPKPQLTQILHRLTEPELTYIFDDSITTLTQQDGGVAVEFEQGTPRTFDLVVGADGLFSKTRRLAFGPHEEALRHLGMSGAGFTADNVLGLDHRGVLQTGDGTAIYAFSAADADKMSVSLSFATDAPTLDRRPRAEQEQALKEAFAGAGWIAPELLKAMSAADDFYFSSSSQVHLDTWSTGRVVLVGDAGYCAAPTAGMGTSQALIGARTLARALSAADGDHATAFTAYEAELRPYVTENQVKGQEGAAAFGSRDQ
ncbi:NAD(P)-binding protein [Streptomyces sp. SID14478]|uniref:FAD-dependent monooxygenase n=1 Tax=Streptomyces sp. SID14478 TaxID=2706073 RepID=UPI0013DEC5E6|nr:FAD-dependent monooxygenase [Streptomyces sp. SID14478]NEB81922.1 NAD(P)-binding protein [Streptomyces sp. SID14478]